MVHRFAVAFEKDPPEDIVNFAVAPIDALSGRIVQGNITATVSVLSTATESGELRLPDKPVRNLSGLLVFINLPDYPKYRVTVSAKTAGYFDPDPIEFTPPAPDDNSDPKNRLRLDFILFPRPGFDFSDEATLVSGVLVRGEEKVQGARISVEVSSTPFGRLRNNGAAKAFETRSDERGAFALAVRLPAFSENGGSGVGVDKGVSVKFRVETRNNSGDWELVLEWDIQIIEGRRQVFKRPIDLMVSDNPIFLMTT
jgi:hypothetical protein